MLHPNEQCQSTFLITNANVYIYEMLYTVYALKYKLFFEHANVVVRFNFC